MVDRFAIYHNIPQATDIKIHDIECSAYTCRNPLAENSDWYTAPTYQTATKIALGLVKDHPSMKYRNCKRKRCRSLTNHNYVSHIKTIMRWHNTNDVDFAVQRIMYWVPTTNKQELLKAAEQIKQELSKPV